MGMPEIWNCRVGRTMNYEYPKENKMTNIELAEKVAEYLGWVKDGNVWNKWESSTYSPVKWLEPLEGKGGIEKVVFSWAVSGMMIEKMEKEGWDISIDLGFMCFLKKLPNGEMGYSKKTKEHCVDNNWHKAIAMAFCEAMEIINENT